MVKSPGLGRGDPASATDLLCGPHPLLSYPQFEHKTGAVKHDREEAWVSPSRPVLQALPQSTWVALGSHVPSLSCSFPISRMKTKGVQTCLWLGP